jgi:UDP-N-acetylglucosamine:LPS N-acetylglucosamine transferase
MGAGHDGVAYELERRLHARGAEAKVYDYLQLLPGGMGPFYRSFYAGQLKYAPSSYEWLYGKIDRGVLAPVARWLGQQGARKVGKLARDYDVVISTYPLGCQATGKLRAAGKLNIPAVGFLTDVDVHGLWLHPGLDRNLTVWSGSAAEAVARVGVPSHAVGPVLPERFRSPSTEAERLEGRELMGLTEDDTVVLVVAGSWGVGEIGSTARAIRDAGVGVPVVLCGRNDDLVRELDREDGIVALGWTTEIRRLLAAADVLVHNAGGLSCLEGFAVGVPVIGYACLPGHGHRNSLAMHEAGVAVDARTEDELLDAIRRLARTPDGAALAQRAQDMFLSDPTDELLDLVGTEVPYHAPPPVRTWTRRVAAVGVGVPVTMSALSFGVAHAGIGTAEGDGYVYVAAIVDHAQIASPQVVTALREYGVSAAIRPDGDAPTPTDVRALTAASVTVVAADPVARSRNPKRLDASIDSAVQAVAATDDLKPKVVCLRNPGMVERVVAFRNKVQLAVPKYIVAGGSALPGKLKAGQQIVLDERGRTPAQVLADLDAVSALASFSHVPQAPMRALWPSA